MLARSALLSVLVALLVSVVLVAPAAAGRNRTAAVKDNFFQPKSLTIGKGATVTWVWRGKAIHNVTKIKGPGARFRSRTQRKGRYSHRFTRKGTYRLNCTIHTGMNMTIRVR